MKQVFAQVRVGPPDEIEGTQAADQSPRPANLGGVGKAPDASSGTGTRKVATGREGLLVHWLQTAFRETDPSLSRSVYRRFRRAIDCSDSDNGVSRKLAPGNRRPRPPAKFRARPRTLFLACRSLGWSRIAPPYKLPIWRLNAPVRRSVLNRTDARRAGWYRSAAHHTSLPRHFGPMERKPTFGQLAGTGEH